MITQFQEKWLAAVEANNSVLCAGLDPAEHAIGRGEKGLPENIIKSIWAENYVKAVAGDSSAFKPNTQYWKKEAGSDARRISDLDSLVHLNQMAHAKGKVVIEDSKLADIGNTNDTGVYYANDKNADAVTFSPFAGNMQEAVNQAHSRGIGLISMCLMSNPEYAREKNKLVNISEDATGYDNQDIMVWEGTPFVKQYIQLAHDAQKFGVDGIVIGAPSPKNHPDPNHITPEEIANVRRYVDDNMLILLPGVGAQGGEAGEIWEHFDKNNVIVNVGRGLMFPNGSDSTKDQQTATAGKYKTMLNELRAKAK